jgi:hypothetical protein
MLRVLIAVGIESRKLYREHTCTKVCIDHVGGYEHLRKQWI